MSNFKLGTMQSSKISGEDYRKAHEQAQVELSFRGITYPVKMPGMSTIAFYDAMKAYGEMEAAIVQRIIKPVPEPRPLAVDIKPVKPKWGQPYCD